MAFEGLPKKRINTLKMFLTRMCLFNILKNVPENREAAISMAVAL